MSMDGMIKRSIKLNKAKKLDAKKRSRIAKLRFIDAMNKLHDKKQQLEMNKTATRKCLKCDKSFISQWSGNRLCLYCSFVNSHGIYRSEYHDKDQAK